MKRNSNDPFVVRRPYDPVIVSAAPVGDLVEGEYRKVTDSNFNSEYVMVGEKNVQEYIDSFKNGCSLKAILDRCSLMPVHDKVRYLNQTEDGFSADMSNMPKDGTEAQIMIQRVKAVCPDFAQRMRNGESFEKILIDYLPKQESAPVVEKKPESEVTA